MSNQIKHTPGPWIVKFGGSPTDEGFGIACNNAAGPRGVIAENWPPGLLDSDRERVAADARLISAAPDLLDSCNELREALAGAIRVMANCGHTDVLDSFDDEMVMMGIHPGVGVRAQRAIEKAKGKP